MIRRTAKIALEILGALLAGLALLVGFVTWRLTNEGPIHLGFLKPYVEDTLNRPGADYQFAIEDTVLSWAGWERTIDVRAVGVRVLDRQGRKLVQVPELSFGLSGAALARGLVAPSRIEIFGPDIRIVRNKEGNFEFGSNVIGENAGDKNGGVESGGDASGVFLRSVLDELLASPDPEKKTGYLTEAAITDAKISVIDRRTLDNWSIDRLRLTFRRSESGVNGSMDATLPQFGDPASMTGSINLPATRESFYLDLQVGNLSASALARLEPGLSSLRQADIDLRGRLRMEVGLDGELGEAVFSMEGGEGRLAMPGVMKEPLPIKALSADGTVDRSKDMISLASLRLDLDGPALELKGDVDGFLSGKASDAGAPKLAATLTGGGIDWSKIDNWWPSGAAEDTRGWLIPNITKGRVDDIHGELILRLPVQEGGPVVVEKLTAAFKTTELTVHYLRPLPPIENGIADAVITDKDFSADIKGGNVGDLKITGGKVHITGLDQEDQFVSVGGDVIGPVADALQLLDHPRLGYAQKLGLDPAGGTGEAQTQLQFDFPAEKDLSFAQVKIGVHAQLANLGLKNAMFGQDVTEGALELALTQEGMKINGPLKFGGIPLELQWLENFYDDPRFESQLRAIGTTTTEQRKQFGYDLGDMIDGPMHADLTYTRFADDKSRLDAIMDLTEAQTKLDFVKWRKDPGIAGEATATVQMVAGKITEVSNFRIAAGDLTTAGSLAFAEGGPKELTLPSVKAGRTALTDVTASFEGDWINVRIGGGDIDVEPWMAEDETPKDEAQIIAEENEPQIPFRVTAEHLASARTGEGRLLKDVSVKLVHDPYWWDVIDVEATLSSGAPLRLVYAPAENGIHRLNATTPDGGEALRALDIYDSIVGGELKIEGKVKDSEPGRPLKGKLESTSFRLVNTPFFVRFLSVAALTGLADALTGEGFYFDGATARFSKKGGRIEVKKFRTAGPSIGLTSSGTIDLDRHNINLEGVLVPAYALNSILGNIPVLGDLLQGGSGEGLFSATYRISGSLGEPQIDVNPWAALAPGLLRDLFTSNNEEEDEEEDGAADAEKETSSAPKPNSGGHKN